jgi:hypothetical protein
VKVLLARVVEFVFTKLYNVSHFARIPAVPLWGLLAGVFKGRKNQGKIHKFSFILLNNLIITIVVDLTRFYDSGIFMQVLEMYFNFFYVTFSYTR